MAQCTINRLCSTLSDVWRKLAKYFAIETVLPLLYTQFHELLHLSSLLCSELELRNSRSICIDLLDTERQVLSSTVHI